MLLPNDFPSLLKLHEQYMADHAMWAQERLGGKTIVWTHNIHMAKGIIDENHTLMPQGSFEGTFRQ